MLLLPTRSHVTYMNIIILLYNTTKICHLKFSNSYSWQFSVTGSSWSSELVLYMMQNVYTISEYTLYRNVSWVMLLHLY